MQLRARAELISGGISPRYRGAPHQTDTWLCARDAIAFCFSLSAFLQKPSSQTVPFLSKVILRVMLWIYVDYFVQLLAVSTAENNLSVYFSVCSVHKIWTICSYKNEQIDVEVFDLLS